MTRELPCHTCLHSTAVMLAAHAAHNTTDATSMHNGDLRAFTWPWRAPRGASLLSGAAALDSMQQAYRGKGCVSPQRLIRCE